MKLITFDATSGPGTNIDKQLPKVLAQGNKAQDISLISSNHDVLYTKIYKGDKNANKKIRIADDTMLNQLSAAMGKEATI